jgi:hypothetical protein
VLRELVKANCAIESRDSQMRTPIWYAAKGGHTETVQFLLSLSCDANAVDNTETSVLKTGSCFFVPMLCLFCAICDWFNIAKVLTVFVC